MSGLWKSLCPDSGDYESPCVRNLEAMKVIVFGLWRLRKSLCSDSGGYESPCVRTLEAAKVLVFGLLRLRKSLCLDSGGYESPCVRTLDVMKKFLASGPWRLWKTLCPDSESNKTLQILLTTVNTFTFLLSLINRLKNLPHISILTSIRIYYSCTIATRLYMFLFEYWRQNAAQTPVVQYFICLKGQCHVNCCNFLYQESNPPRPWLTG